MLRWLKKRLGLVPSFEEFGAMKEKALSALLGPAHDTVQHASIPFVVGGPLDLYYYVQPRGFAIATQELIDEFGDGPKSKAFQSYELAIFSEVPFDLAKTGDPATPVGRMHERMSGLLNAVARYAFHAKLNPGETMEFPADFDESIGGQCIICDEWTKDGQGLMIGPRRFGLLVLINIHRSEMDFARQNGSEALFARLREKGHYPFSDLDRPPVA